MYVYRNFAFAAHPKTASISVSEALLNAGWQRMGGHHDVRYSNSQQRTICVVREPRDWLVSWYYYLGAQKYKQFEQWLAEWENPFIESHGTHWFALRHSEFVLFHGVLQRGINDLFHDLRLRKVVLPHSNVSMARKGVRASVLFEPESVERIYMDRFGDLDSEFQKLRTLRGDAAYLRKAV